MRSNARKRFTALVLSLLLLSSTALAEDAVVMKDALVYSAAKTSSEPLGKLKAGTQLELIAEKDGWVKVERNGKIGYMDADAVSEYRTYDAKAAYTTQSTAMYQSFSTSSKKLGTIAKGEKLYVYATAGEWARAKYNGHTGFVKLENLSTTAPTVQTSSTYTAYAKADNAKVYNSDGKAIGKVSANTEVTVLAEKNGVCRVQRGDAIAYMMKSDLSAQKVETSAAYQLKYGDKGEAVSKVQARLKELGYFSGTVGGNYLDLTQASVRAFQTAAGLSSSGICDEATLTALFSESAPKKEATKADGSSTATPATGTAKEMDWWNSSIQSIFSRGTVATITDVSTGIAWQEKRTGGTNHADVQPLTASDTAAMKQAVGSWSWTRRAIFVTIDGVNYAASMNCMPHGSGSITDNNFSGHHCIHFTNSRTHGSNKVCSLHQAAIQKAAAATL